MPSAAGKTSAITHAAQVKARPRPARCGRDKPVDRVAGGDRGEPGAQADVVIQRGHGVQVRLLQRPDAPGRRTRTRAAIWAAALPAGPADHDTGQGQHQQQAGPGPGLAEHRQRGGRARHPGQHRPLETTQVAAPAGSAARRPAARPWRPGASRHAGPRAGRRRPGERSAARARRRAGRTAGEVYAAALAERQGGGRRDHPAGRRFPRPRRGSRTRPPARPGTPPSRRRWRTPPGARSCPARRTARRRRTRPAARTAGKQHPTARPWRRA